MKISTTAESYHAPSATLHASVSNTNLITDVDGVTDEYHTQKVQSALLFYTVFSVIFFIGIVGNSMLILIFSRHKNMRTPANTYIFNLAVADLITILNCALIPVMGNIGESYPTICKLSQIVMEFSMGVTALTLIALSIERYYAIVHPLLRRMSSQRFTLTVVFTTWIVSLTYNCTKMFILLPNKKGTCVRVQMFDPNTYTITDFFFLYLIPLIVIAYCYILMAYKLYFGANTLSKGASGGSTSHRSSARKRIAVAVLILVAMFALFHLPVNVISLKLHSEVNHVQNGKWAPLITVLLCMGCLHNSFNPIVLYVLSTPYREHFNNYLLCNIFHSPVLVEDEPLDSKKSNTGDLPTSSV